MAKAPTKEVEPRIFSCGNCDCEFELSSRSTHNEYGWFCSPVCGMAVSMAEQQRGEIPLRGPCKYCGDEFFSHSERVYCSVECFKDSPDYGGMMWDALKTGFPEKPTKISGTHPCLQCGVQFRPNKGNVGPGRRGCFCGVPCRQKYDSLRFDRWYANPVLLCHISGYDEFLVGEQTLGCPYPGCSWQGHNLSNHGNKYHGIPSVELKRAAGFSDSTGLISIDLRLRQNRIAKDREAAGKISTAGLTGWRELRRVVARELPEADYSAVNAETSKRYSEFLGHVQTGEDGEKIYVNAAGQRKKNLGSGVRSRPMKSAQFVEYRQKRYDPSRAHDATCRECDKSYRRHVKNQKRCSDCSTARSGQTSRLSKLSRKKILTVNTRTT